MDTTCGQSTLTSNQDPKHKYKMKQAIAFSLNFLVMFIAMCALPVAFVIVVLIEILLIIKDTVIGK